MLKTKLIEMESITFNDGESDKEPFIPSTFNTWEKANEYIVKRAFSVISPESYLKTFFEVEFNDGGIFKGRYDIKHHSKENGDLGWNIINKALYYSGNLKHSSMEDREKYLNLIRKIVPLENRQHYILLLRDYFIPTSVKWRDHIAEENSLNEDLSQKDLEQNDFILKLKHSLREIESAKLFKYGRIATSSIILKCSEQIKEFSDFVIDCLLKHLLGNNGEAEQTEDTSIIDSLYSFTIEHKISITTDIKKGETQINLIAYSNQKGETD